MLTEQYQYFLKQKNEASSSTPLLKQMCFPVNKWLGLHNAKNTDAADPDGIVSVCQQYQSEVSEHCDIKSF